MNNSDQQRYLPPDIIYYSHLHCGVPKFNPFIKFNSTDGVIPQYFKIESDDVIPIREEVFSSFKFSRILEVRLPRLLLRPFFRYLFREKPNNSTCIIEEMTELKLYDFISEYDNQIMNLFDTFSSHLKFNDTVFEMYDPEKKDDAVFLYYGEIVRLLKSTDKYYGFKNEIIEPFLSSKITEKERASLFKKYSIIVTLLCRINMLSFLIKEFKKTKQINSYFNVYHNLHLFMDTHIELVYVIQKFSIFDNDRLNNCDYNPFSPNHSIYEQFYPRENGFFDHSDTFDLSRPLCNSGRKVRECNKKNETNIQTVMQKIFTKLGVFTCQKRGIIEAISENLEVYKDLEEFLKRTILITLLGNIEYCRERPEFELRMKIHQFFDYEYTENNLKKFIKEWRFSIILILREFFVYYCSIDSSYDRFSRKFNKWNEIEKLIKKSGESIRNILAIRFETFENSIENNEFLFSKPLISFVTTHSKEIGPQFSKYGKKLSKVIPEIFFYSQMEFLHNCKLAENQADYVDVDTYYIPSEVYYRILTIVDHIHDSGAMHTRSFFQTKWLKYLGISEKSFQYIRKVYWKYCCLDKADHSILKKMIKLSLNNYDFNLTRIFLKNLVHKYNFLRFILPREIYKKSVECNSRKLNLDSSSNCFSKSNTNLHRFKSYENFDEYSKENTDFEAFSSKPITGKYSNEKQHTNYCEDNITFDFPRCYYCENCEKWAGIVMEVGDEYTKKRMSSFTPKDCAIEISTGNLVCLRAIVTNQSSETNLKNEKKKEKPKTLSELLDNAFYENLKKKFSENNETTSKKNSLSKIAKENNNKKKHEIKSFCTKTNLVPVDLNGIIQKLDKQFYTKCSVCDSIIKYDSSKIGILGITCCNHENYTNELITPHKTNNILLSLIESEKCIYCGATNVDRKNGMLNRIVKVIAFNDIDPSNLRLEEIFICSQHYQMIGCRTVFPSMSKIISQIQSKQDRSSYRWNRKLLK